MQRSNKSGFPPIGMENFIDKHLKINPDVQRAEIEYGLKSALRDYRAGVKCGCGNPIWVIGSAVVGNACFACITGEAQPDGDYEIDAAMK